MVLPQIWCHALDTRANRKRRGYSVLLTPSKSFLEPELEPSIKSAEASPNRGNSSRRLARFHGRGIKTTTAAILGLLAWSRLRKQSHVSISTRTLPGETAYRAMSLFAVAFG